MVPVFFFYGLAFFSLGLAVLLESRRSSELPLGKQLPWLAAFGLTHSAVEWSDMLLLTTPDEPLRGVLVTIRTVLLPLSTLFLIRFGIGLISEKGPLPRWLSFSPLVLFIPVSMLVTYALVVIATEPPLDKAADIWSRYLLYFPGSLLSFWGLVRQWRGFPTTGLKEGRHMLLGAALAFLVNAVVAGLVVPPASYGLAPWLNADVVLTLTGIPVQVLRMVSAVAVTLFVIRALNVFEGERRQQLQKLRAEREQAQETLRESEERFRNIFEYAPIGLDIVKANGTPMQANRAFQKMLGYTNEEFQQMAYTDYTHKDDLQTSKHLVQEMHEGKRDFIRLQKRYCRKDGGIVWANVAVSAVRDAQGAIRYFIGMVEDITERKLAEERLRLEREQAQAAKVQALTVARQEAEAWANSLVEISRHIANMESADSVLLHIAKEARQLLKSDIVSIGLLDESGSQLELKCQATARKTYTLDNPVVVHNDLLLRVLRSRAPYRYPEDASVSQPAWYCPTVVEEIQAAAVVPLQFDDQLIGGLWVGRFTPHSFTVADLVGLENLADQAVIALQHALMASRLQSLATLEERSRIAREMHDGLAQILGYLGLQMQTLKALVNQGDSEKVLLELDQTRQNIKTAQADVRENILSLRTTLANEDGLIPALKEYIEEFGVQTGTRMEFTNELNGRSLSLSPLAEVQLVRIVQEALANVRKHAQAQEVAVRLTIQNNNLYLSVKDDGIGFRPSVRQRHFGLQTMHERAKSVGGCLNITSRPGEGTTVQLWLPLIKE